MIRRFIPLAVLALASCNLLAQSATPAPEASKKSGQQIFLENCSRCHGPDGSSNTFIGHRWHIPDLRSEPVQKLAIEQRIAIITPGSNMKPASLLSARLACAADGSLTQLIQPVA